MLVVGIRHPRILPGRGQAGAVLQGKALDWLRELRPLIHIVLRDGKMFPEGALGLRQVIATGGMTRGLEQVMAAADRTGRDPVASAVIVIMASLGFLLVEDFFGGPVQGVDAPRFAAALADLLGDRDP